MAPMRWSNSASLGGESGRFGTSMSRWKWLPMRQKVRIWMPQKRAYWRMREAKCSFSMSPKTSCLSTTRDMQW